MVARLQLTLKLTDLLLEVTCCGAAGTGLARCLQIRLQLQQLLAQGLKVVIACLQLTLQISDLPFEFTCCSTARIRGLRCRQLGLETLDLVLARLELVAQFAQLLVLDRISRHRFELRLKSFDARLKSDDRVVALEHGFLRCDQLFSQGCIRIRSGRQLCLQGFAASSQRGG